MPRIRILADGTEVPFTPEEEIARDAEEAAEQAALAAAERQRIIAAVQSILDDHARSWGYDDLRSAASYIGDPFTRFNAEGIALRDWRSAVWVYASQASAATVEEFLAGLPPPPQRPETGLS